jgi:hypothetical protein
LELDSLKTLFWDTFGFYSSEFARFVGFKTSCGTENFPNFWQGAPGLFIFPRMATFSSMPNNGSAVMTTGIYYSEAHIEFA